MDDKYDSEFERIIADYLIYSLNIKNLSLEKPLLFGNSLQYDTVFEERLITFALKRKISLLNPGWRDRAVNLAAREHPELNPKRPGRRKKSLIELIPDENPPELVAVERIQKLARERDGREVSDVEACRQIVAGVSGIDLPGITHWRPGDTHFNEVVNSLKTKVSRQRQMVGRPKRRVTKNPE